MIGWHFSAEDRRLGYGDGRRIKLGRTHKVKAQPVLCQAGLHASKMAFDALRYAPGPVLWRVELGGTIVHGNDKSCATERRYIAGGVDASPMLREFARRCALDVIHLWDAPDIVRQYLETGDETLRDAAWAAASAEARAATWAAARDEAWNATRAAANAVAREAAREAAWDAAWAAASAEARNAAWVAANAVAGDHQRQVFEAMALKLIEAAE